MKYGNDDLAKYTFMPEAGNYIRANEISITDLVTPVFKDVVNRAQERILEAIKATKVSDKSSDNRDVEIMSFPVALMLVRSTNLNHLMERYSLAEAKRVESLLKQEDNGKIIEDIFQTFLGVKLEHAAVSSFPGFRISMSDYVKRAVGFHKPEWKLVNRIVQNGKVYVSQTDLIRLIREEIQDLILQRLKATNVPKLPKELDAAVKNLIELTPPPRSTFTSLNIAPENYPPCTKPDEIILGDNVSIREMRIGGHAIGRTGLSNVTNTFVRNYSGPMIKIKAQGLLPVELTPEHPLLVCASVSRPNGKIIGFTEPEWKPAKDVIVKPLAKDGDYLVTPVLDRKLSITELDISIFTTARGLAVAHGRGTRLSLPLTKETAWLMGIYVAEGWSTPTKGEVVLAFDHSETEFQDRVLKIARNLGYSPRKVKENTACKCFISSFLLARAFRSWFGQGARNKKIPDFVMLHKDDEILRAFLKGWEDGDGHWYANEHEKTKQHFAGATFSKTLGLQLQILYMSLKIGANLIRVPRAGAGTICGRKVTLSDVFIIDYSTTGSNICRTKESGRFFFHPVRKIDVNQYDGPVHNIETSDNSFLVSNAIVHNCVKESLRLLEKGENVPHYGRFLMATYLLAVGKTVDDIMGLFPKSPDFKKSITQYQVEHIAGMKGGRTKYTVPSCKTLQTHSFCFKDPVKCYEISSTLQYPSRKIPPSGIEGTRKKETTSAGPKEEKRKGWTKTRR
ncbi:MAG: hypothetical protein ACYCPP_01840 [Nitrososphaerales archaeon]